MEEGQGVTDVDLDILCEGARHFSLISVAVCASTWNNFSSIPLDIEGLFNNAELTSDSRSLFIFFCA